MSLSSPREVLLNDEGSAGLHFVAFGDPDRSWTSAGAGRDLQLIGNGRVLRSQPRGFVELDLNRRGALVRDVSADDLPGVVESARRLVNGHTVIIGNGAHGVFVCELDHDGRLFAGRKRVYAGIEKARMVRLGSGTSFLFCSETHGRSLVHEGTWLGELRTLFEVPEHIPADSMVKAVPVGPDRISVSTGYAASLLIVDTSKNRVLKTIGGPSEPAVPETTRPLRPFFFSGYQMFGNDDVLIANWQGHGPGHRGLGYQLLRYDRDGRLIWAFDQTQHAGIESINNVIALDGLDLRRLHDEPQGVLVPVD